MALDIVIRNEAEAWAWLEKALQAPAEIKDVRQIRFEGWPTLDLKYSGKDFYSSVPTRMMPVLLDAQREVNRLYARAIFGEDNLRRMTSEDRERTELVVKVKPGSSEYETNLQDVLTEIALRSVDKMDSIHLLILLLGSAVIFGSVIGWKAWLKTKEKIKEVDSRVSMSKSEEQKLAVMANALTKVHQLRDVAEGVDQFRNASLTKLEPEDKFAIPGTNLMVDGQHAAAVTESKREQSAQTTITGQFTILSVDSGALSGYRLKVRSLDNPEDTFLVAIPDKTFSMDILNAVRDGEWGKRPVQMQIKGRLLRGQLHGAVLVSAELVKDGDSE